MIYDYSSSFLIASSPCRSGSMGGTDHMPLPNTPSSARIAQTANNRLGAVYSSLYAFWSARLVATGQISSTASTRLDAYTVILFDHSPFTSVVNDFTTTPNGLLETVLAHSPGGGTNFNSALNAAEREMETHWCTDR